MASRSLPGHFKPQLLSVIQFHVDLRIAAYTLGGDGVPRDIATPDISVSFVKVESEDPLLFVLILKIPDIDAPIAAIHRGCKATIWADGCLQFEGGA